MALYALGDLHLSFQANKPMDAFGKVWKYHERKIEKYVNQIVGPEDTLVLTGDHSWGRKLPECREDLTFIERLPGRKILLRGNHDMFWDVGKTKRLNEEFAGKLFFLQNNFAVYQDYALVGTKGYTFEGPFYLDRPASGIVSHGAGGGVSKVSDVSALSAHEYSGRNLAVYGDCGGVRRGGCGVFPLPRGAAVWGQYPRNLSWDSVSVGFGRLSWISAGAGGGVSGC